MSKDATTSDTGQARTARKAAQAGFLGTLIEYFEFISYGLLAVVIAPQFFPSQDPVASVLAALTVFATGYLVRPIGGIFFGWLGDRAGRKVALVATVVSMGGASAALGLLPNYALAGIAAPILLVLVRLVQGFSAGGEIIGAVTYVAESAPDKRRGFFNAMTPLGSVVGGALAGIIAGTTALSATAEQMSAWGWRIPFLLCIPLTLIALWVRLRLEDTPEFEAMLARSEVTKAPLLSALRSHPGGIAKVALITLAVQGFGAIGTTYLTIHLISDLKLPQGQVFLSNAASGLLSAVAIILVGRIADRTEKSTLLMAAMAASLVVAVPVFWFVNTFTGLLVVLGSFAVWGFTFGGQNPPAMSTFASLFPRNVRYSAAAFGYNIGAVLGAGLMPLAAQLLAVGTHNSYAPAFLAVALAAIGLVTVGTTRRKAKDYFQEQTVGGPAPIEPAPVPE